MHGAKFRSHLIAACVVAACWSNVRAGVPGIHYGGRLTSTDGAPIAGPVDLELAFFAAESGGSERAAALQLSGVALNSGMFDIELPLTGAQLQTILGAAATVYVEVRDATHGKVYPRQRFGSVPYAWKVPVDGDALTWDPLGNLTVATGLLAGKADATHSHAMTDVTGLAAALATKAGATHSHTLAGDVSGDAGAAVVGKLQGSPVVQLEHKDAGDRGDRRKRRQQLHRDELGDGISADDGAQDGQD